MPVTVRSGSWAEVGAEAWRIRRRVFGGEQGVSEEHDRDPRDADAFHLLLIRDGEAIGTARLLRDGTIGRVALLPTARGHGLGRVLMEAVEDLARRHGIRRVHLHAQVHATGFYARLGYHRHGEPFVEAGILHNEMEKTLG